MGIDIQLPDGRTVDLGYFVEWRPWLWAKPVMDAIAFMGNLHGRTVLEIGGRYGRMSSLFALLGAKVTMLDMGDLSVAQAEVTKWSVSDRIKMFRTKGEFDDIAGQKFDVIFTKSVLWSIENLSPLLAELDQHLADGGKIAFVENYRGSNWMINLRRLIRGKAFCYGNRYYGIKPQHIALFADQFAELNVKRYRWLIYEILGCKKRPS